MEGFFLGSAVDYQGTSFKPGDFPETSLITPQRAISLLSYPEGQIWPGREPQTSMSEGDGVWVWRGGLEHSPTLCLRSIKVCFHGMVSQGGGEESSPLKSFVL